MEKGCLLPPPHTHPSDAPDGLDYIIFRLDWVIIVLIRCSCDRNESNDLQSFSILRDVKYMLTGYFSGTCTGYRDAFHFHLITFRKLIVLYADRKLNLYSCSRLSKVRELTDRGIGTGGMGQGPKFSGNTKTAFSPVTKCPFAFVKKCYSDYIFYDCNHFSLSPWPTFPGEIFQVPFSFQKCPSKPPPPPIF